MCVIFIIGLMLIFSAPSLGENARKDYVGFGNSYEPYILEIIVKETIRSYQLGGLIVSLISGFGILLSEHTLYK